MRETRGWPARLGLTRETLRALAGLTGGLAAEAREALPGVLPPARPAYGAVTADVALTLGDVFRAFSLLATAASQLPLEAVRAGQALPAAGTPALVRRPDVACSQSAWIEAAVLSLAADGNAFLQLTRADAGDPTSRVLNARILPPALVAVELDPQDGRLRYHYAGEPGTPAATFRDHEVRHLKLLAVPGRLRGLGPIQAAQAELRGALQLRDYSAGWFDPASGAALATATLSTDQPLTPTQAKEWGEAWHADRTPRTRVLGHGLKYASHLISPKDAQFLESRQFTVTELARLFGLPASLMLATVEGGAQTYANVEQDWLGFVRFSLMQYLREIEQALTELLPRGLEARFNVAGLLRTDTLTRYQAHEVGIRGGFLTVNEARAVENLPPIPGGDAPAPSSLPASPPATTPTALEAPQ